jgi:hypothetical protein
MVNLIKESINTAKHMVQTIAPRPQPKGEDYYNTNYPEDYDYDGIEPDNVRWELEYSDVLDRYEHSLKNERKDAKTGIWYRPKNVKPRLNDNGVADIMSDLRGIMHKGTALGNIHDDYAREQTKSMGKSFAKKLVHNTIAWDVEISHRKTLVLSYSNQVYMTLTRPVGDKERKHRSKKYNLDEKYHHDEIHPDEIRRGQEVTL